MNALLVHGMGRSPLSFWPLSRRLDKAGIQTSTFSYAVSLSSFADIQARLVQRITQLAQEDGYILIGHSLGGVLIRAAVASLPASTPRPRHIFLLGSPIQPSRLAQRLATHPVYRAITRDCGQLLASPRRMADIAASTGPVTGIAGTRGFSGRLSPFGHEPNDGIVALSEVSADWLTDQVQLPVIHSLLPSSAQVANIILGRLGA
jgi:pimeloyl-ACP methyl ester carboxylesterase